MNKKSNMVVFLIIVAVMVGLVGFFTVPISKRITKGLDLGGGWELVYDLSPLAENSSMPDKEVIIESIESRIKIIGVSEAQVIVDTNNKLRIRLAGIENIEQVEKIIASSSNLTFRDIEDNLLMGREVIAENGAVMGYDGGDPVIGLKISDLEKFGDITGEIAKRPSGENIIVTWLDFEEGVDSYEKQKDLPKHRFISAASVSSRIDGDAVIRGDFTAESAWELAALINAGPLPIVMTKMAVAPISPAFGQNAFDLVALAGLIGLVAIMLFMLFFYRLPGLVSALVLPFFIFINILIYNLLQGVLSLPALIALIIGVAIAVDANIISFEKIKDDIYLGRNIQRAVKEGQSAVTSTIIDAQLTALIVTIIAYLLSSGVIKSFTTMFMVTISCSILFQYFLSKYLLNLLASSGFLNGKYKYFGISEKDIPDVEKGEERKYYGKLKTIDFVKIGKTAIPAVLLVVILGVSLVLFNTFYKKDAFKYGIDFTGGSIVVIESKESLKDSEVRKQFAGWGYHPSTIQISGEEGKTASILFAGNLSSDAIKDIKTKAKEAYQDEVYSSNYYPSFSTNHLRNVILISLAATVALLLYVSLRFKINYAVAAAVALVHDILLIIAIFAILRWSVNFATLAVILTVIIYSIYDSLIVFAKLKENESGLKRKKVVTSEDYEELVNRSAQQVLFRSIISLITSLIPIIVLLVVAPGGLFVISIAVILAVIVSCYSSLFVALQCWLKMQIKRKPKAKVSGKKKTKKNEPKELTFVGINDVR